jgi:hypothetical protein
MSKGLRYLSGACSTFQLSPVLMVTACSCKDAQHPIRWSETTEKWYQNSSYGYMLIMMHLVLQLGLVHLFGRRFQHSRSAIDRPAMKPF